MTKKEIIKRAKRIRAIVADVDGVLTGGRIIYGNDGLELKEFHVHDGLAVALARRCGLKVILVSARSSDALSRRGLEMGVDRLWQGVDDKLRIFDLLREEFAISPEEICFLGDDLPDLPLIARAGLGVAVPSAAGEVKRKACIITGREGGSGALREVIELVLKARGEWRSAISEYES